MDPRQLRIEGYFARESEHTVDSLRQTLARTGLDGAWLRMRAITGVDEPFSTRM